jgi:mannose-6-phosphate isomerase
MQNSAHTDIISSPARRRPELNSLYPLFFHPIFKERIWGGRSLERLFKKQLPPAVAIGESWEIVDRTDENSIIANGPLAGVTLHSLMESHRAALLGTLSAADGRFPWLIKILDAQQKLSLQVHPPASKARALGGEPKTEMWYVAEAGRGADLFVGLKRGVTRSEFEDRLKQGSVQDCFHRIEVAAGDAMFLPSGRVHALGAGNVIFEVQQNSDTTYRVFDWNRVEANGKPRELHIEKSLASIDFDDFEPSLLGTATAPEAGNTVRPLVNDPLFRVDLVELPAGGQLATASDGPTVLAVIEGSARIEGSAGIWAAAKGAFCLVPAATKDAGLTAVLKSTVLRVRHQRAL